jgi:hypothetical protein
MFPCKPTFFDVMCATLRASQADKKCPTQAGIGMALRGHEQMFAQMMLSSLMISLRVTVARAMRRSLLMLGLAAMGVCLSACGGSNSSAPATTSEGEAETSSTGTVPPELLGTWTTTLKESDLPANAPPELTDAATEWELQIAETGGTDNGPVLSIVNPELGQLEGPTLQVQGNQLKLLQEECAATGETEFFDNAYSYEIQGNTLRITTVSNQCSDHVAETILTSEPWTKSG